MKPVTMLGCAMVEVAVLSAPEAEARVAFDTVPWNVIPMAVDPVADEHGTVGVSQASSSSQDSAGTHPSAARGPEPAEGGRNPTNGAPTRTERVPPADVGARDFSPADCVSAMVPGAGLGDSVCVIDPDNGEVTLVSLSELTGFRGWSLPPPGLSGDCNESSAGPPANDVEMSLEIHRDFSLPGSGVAAPMGFTPHDASGGARDALTQTDVVSRAVVSADSGPCSEFREMNPIPEPTTFALLGLGSLLLVIRRPRREREGQAQIRPLRWHLEARSG